MIRIFFAPPRVGKTTFAVKMIKKRARSRRCYSNFDQKVPGASVADFTGLGNWTLPRGSYVSMDEAGIDYNSRNYKTFPFCLIRWLKKHGHEELDVDCFSQSYDDIDLTFRRLAEEYWLLRRIGPWTIARRLIPFTDVDKDTGQIVTKYQKASKLSLIFFMFQKRNNKKWMLTFRPFYYKYFDSWDVDPTIPVRDFPVNPKLPRWWHRFLPFG